MTKLSNHILDKLKTQSGLSDRELANILNGTDSPQQPINSLCRKLESKGFIHRRKRSDGIIGNYLTGLEENIIPENNPTFYVSDIHSEDHVKKCIANWLKENGWQPQIKWGRDRGIDIIANRNNKRWIIEVKGLGSYQQMRVNYFLGVLAETLQRMDDPDALYSVAFPDIAQYRGLWKRLPALAKKRTCISALFISTTGEIELSLE